MAKWKLFGKSKKEKTADTIEINSDEPQETTHIYIEEETNTDETTDIDKPLAEYNETLQSGKKNITIVEEDGEEGYIENESSHEQRVWRNVKKIEENIDNLHVARAIKPKDNIEKTVDELVEKNKKKKK